MQPDPIHTERPLTALRQLIDEHLRHIEATGNVLASLDAVPSGRPGPTDVTVADRYRWLGIDQAA